MSWVESFSGSLAAGDLSLTASFAVAFLGGLVAGFGPCVLPMMPAVFGYVTGSAAREVAGGRPATLKAFGLAAVFVVGMSLVFTAIGVAAGLLGRAVIVGTWAYYAVAAVCVLLGLQMLGLVDLRFDALNRYLPQRRPERRGFLGAFLFGMLFGVVATPCSTPILAAIAAMAAVGASAAKGGGLLFVFGLGKGVPLLVLGLASGSLSLMRGFSRAAGILTKTGGVALMGVAGYLVWAA
ncbi:MAG: sulfite exporter TauE/SafE family protein [Coriobacteriia bacterium]|nr:sulfite exporter TauE/SafE family protein [Coriobacteriia bacterium]